MARIIGIGGVFFKSKDPKTLQKWYEEVLGLETDDAGYIYFMWNDLPHKGKQKAYTLWAPFSADTTYFEPSTADFMVNFSVDDLASFASALKDKGVQVEDIQETPQGKFTWVMDPEGNRIELWEPAE